MSVLICRSNLSVLSPPIYLLHYFSRYVSSQAACGTLYNNNPVCEGGLLFLFQGVSLLRHAAILATEIHVICGFFWGCSF